MMIKRWLVLAAVTAVAAALVAGAGATAGRDQFAGAWVGQEASPPSGDGSTNFMVIGRQSRNRSRTWLWYETYATFCGGGPLAAAGKGRSDGQVLTVTVTRLRCANGSPGAIPTPFDLTFVATTDGHLDFGGLIFSRIGSG